MEAMVYLFYDSHIRIDALRALIKTEKVKPFLTYIVKTGKALHTVESLTWIFL